MSNVVKLPKIFKPLDEPYRYKVMYGGRGCIHADTKIDTPSGQIKVKNFNGGDIYSLSDMGVIVAHAEKPVMYPVTPLYKITFDNGYSMTCTENHKFFTGTAWLKCHEVYSGRVPVSFLSPQLTNSDIYPLACELDAQHYLRRVLNFLYCYLMDHRQYDEQPQREVNTYLDVLQILAGEEQHKSHALIHSDDLVSESKCSHLSFSSHLSSLAFLLEEEARDYEALGNYVEPRIFEQSSVIYQAARRFHENKNLPELIQVFCNSFQLIVFSSSIHQEKSFLKVLHMLSHGVDDDSYSDSLVNCKHNLHYTIPATIEEVEADNYYDLFVPIYNNYLTSGVVNHNSAKSWTVARKLILKACEEPLLILCTRELQKSIKQSVHRLLKDQINAMGVSGFFEITDNSIKGKNGSEFIFLGTKHNPEEIKSTEGVDICWIEEAHNLTEKSWDIIDPTIRKHGSEIWATFNTRFKFDHIYQLFIANQPPPGSWVQMVNHQDNKWFKETTMPAQMEHMKDVDFEKYLHIWEGQLKILAQGAIFGQQVLKAREEGRFCKIPIISGSPVFTFWDLGRNDHTAIWFMQVVGKEYRMIDYYENRLKDIEHYCRVVKGQASDKEMREAGITSADQSRRQDYIYETHYMPHDIDTVVLGMSETRKKQFNTGGVKPIHTVPRIGVKNEAIEMGRQIFSQVWFDTERCERGNECLANYRYEYNDDKDTHNVTPHHDWASNGADAFMQFAQGFIVPEEQKPLPPARKQRRA